LTSESIFAVAILLVFSIVLKQKQSLQMYLYRKCICTVTCITQKKASENKNGAEDEPEIHTYVKHKAHGKYLYQCNHRNSKLQSSE
jgi:hypothetical protein